MVAVMSKGFDPAEHLTKQGWKGKGTGESMCPPLIPESS